MRIAADGMVRERWALWCLGGVMNGETMEAADRNYG